MTGPVGATVSALAAPDAASALWYLDRATGVVSLVLLTAVLVLGVLTRGARAPFGLLRFEVAGLHRNLALLASSLLVIHVATAVVDSYAPIRLLDTVVPFVSAYRPVWLGLGACALDLLLAVVVTSLLRLRIGRRSWRAVHLLTWLAWPVALVHGLGTGSDARTQWLLGVVAACVAAVVLSALWRVVALSDLSWRQRVGMAAGVVVAPVALALWTVTGPLAGGWAGRSGTPVALLGGGTVATARGAAGQAATSAAAAPSGTASLTGTEATRDLGNGLVAVILSADLRGGPGGHLRIELTGSPLDEGGVALASGVVTLTPASGGSWSGPVDGLSGGAISATLHHGSHVIRCAADVHTDDDSRTVLGAVTLA